MATLQRARYNNAFGKLGVDNQARDKTSMEATDYRGSFGGRFGDKNTPGRLRQVVEANANGSVVKVGINNLAVCINKASHHVSHRTGVVEVGDVARGEVPASNVGAVFRCDPHGEHDGV
jgi:hypothetical protein